MGLFTRIKELFRKSRKFTVDYIDIDSIEKPTTSPTPRNKSRRRRCKKLAVIHEKIESNNKHRV